MQFKEERSELGFWLGKGKDGAEAEEERGIHNMRICSLA